MMRAMRAATCAGSASVAGSASGDRVGVHAACPSRPDRRASTRTPVPSSSAAEDPAQVILRRLRDAVGAPARIGLDRRVGADVHDRARARAAPSRRRAPWSAGTGRPGSTSSTAARSSHSVSSSSRSGAGPSVLALCTSTSIVADQRRAPARRCGGSRPCRRCRPRSRAPRRRARGSRRPRRASAPGLARHQRHAARRARASASRERARRARGSRR